MTATTYLYAFATPIEFLTVFPEFNKDADQIGTCKLIPLPGGLGYACILGMGILDFSVNMSFVLAQSLRQGIQFKSVVILGVCGAYPGRGINLLDVVRIDSETVGDLGYQEKDGSFCPFPSTVRASAVELAPEPLRKLRSVTGLTVNRCTGTEELGKFRTDMFNADIENMEGAAGISACRAFFVPVFEVRAVCNMASTRDKESWQFFEALAALRKAVFEN